MATNPFSGPTPRQLELQAQARARGGLTSEGIRKFKSKSKTKAEEENISVQEAENLLVDVQREKLGIGRPRPTIQEGLVNKPPMQEGLVNFPPSESKPTINRVSTRDDVFRYGDSLPSTPRVGSVLNLPDRTPSRLDKTKEVIKKYNPFSINQIIIKRAVEAEKRLGEQTAGAASGTIPGLGLTRTAAPAIGRFLFTGSGTVARGTRAVIGSEFIFRGATVAEKASRDKQQRELIKQLEKQGVDFDKAFTKVLREESIKVSGTTKDQELQVFGKQFQPSTALFGKPLTLSLRNIIYNIPGGQLVAGDKSFFKKEFIKELTSQGISTEEATKAAEIALRQRKAQGFGEIGSALNLSRGAESIGRNLVARKLAQEKAIDLSKKEAGKLLLTTVGTRTAVAGAFEGSVGEVYSRRARGFEQDAKGTLFAAGIGAGTAGLLGGTIARTSVTSPKVSTFVRRGSYILDPYEKPGDIFQDITENVLSKRLKKSYLQPTISTRGSRVSIGVGTRTTTTTPTQDKKQSMKKRKKPYTFNDLVKDYDSSFTVTDKPITGTRQPDTTPTIQETNEFKRRYDNTINSYTQSFNTQTQTNIPTSTPLFRIPPPIPLTLPGSMGGVGFSPKRGKKYVNELLYGKSVLTGLLGGQRPTKKQNVKKKPTKRKKK